MPDLPIPHAPRANILDLVIKYSVPVIVVAVIIFNLITLPPCRFTPEDAVLAAAVRGGICRPSLQLFLDHPRCILNATWAGEPGPLIDGMYAVVVAHVRVPLGIFFALFTGLKMVDVPAPLLIPADLATCILPSPLTDCGTCHCYYSCSRGVQQVIEGYAKLLRYWNERDGMLDSL